MRTEHIETVIVGAGQAGLATGYHLQRAGRPFVILDGESRVGDGWRNQWDTLRLFSPAWADSLPGMPHPGPRWSYPTKDEFADYLEAYAVRFGLPVRLATRVTSVGARRRRLSRDHRGVAHRVRRRGPLHRHLRPHATGAALRRPARPVHPAAALERVPAAVAAGRRHGARRRRLPLGVRHRVRGGRHPPDGHGRAGHRRRSPSPFTSPLAEGRVPGDAARLHPRPDPVQPCGPQGAGGVPPRRRRGCGSSERDLAERGVDWVQGGSSVSPTAGRCSTTVGWWRRATVVWCTGFRQAFDWVDLPAFDENGWPREYRGVVDDVPGLFFCGIQFQYAAASMIVHGVGRDAAHVARRIDKRHAGYPQRGPGRGLTATAVGRPVRTYPLDRPATNAGFASTLRT